jgi:hypothetical protein
MPIADSNSHLSLNVFVDTGRAEALLWSIINLRVKMDARIEKYARWRCQYDDKGAKHVSSHT